jgi:phospholipid/cholesterol/gamma-HCH transport system substrate-binding protein
MDAIAKLNKALDGLAAMANPENQQNLRLTLQNMAKASADAAEATDSLRSFALDARKMLKDIGGPTTRAAENVNVLTQKLIGNSEELSRLLMTFNQAATKLQSGDGTMGKLVNDPKLYNNMLDATYQMTKTLEELRTVIQSWKDHGLPIKLK